MVRAGRAFLPSLHRTHTLPVPASLLLLLLLLLLLRGVDRLRQASVVRRYRGTSPEYRLWYCLFFASPLVSTLQHTSICGRMDVEPVTAFCGGRWLPCKLMDAVVAVVLLLLLLVVVVRLLLLLW